MVTGVQTCALPIAFKKLLDNEDMEIIIDYCDGEEDSCFTIAMHEKLYVSQRSIEESAAIILKMLDLHKHEN